MSAADENENENEERRILLLIRERKRVREREKVKQKTREKTSKKSKKDKLSFWFVCEIVFSLDVFWLAQKKNIRADDRDTQKRKRCSEFQRDAKKAKKGEKRRKRISLPRTFI